MIKIKEAKEILIEAIADSKAVARKWMEVHGHIDNFYMFMDDAEWYQQLLDKIDSCSDEHELDKLLKEAEEALC